MTFPFGQIFFSDENIDGQGGGFIGGGGQGGVTEGAGNISNNQQTTSRVVRGCQGDGECPVGFFCDFSTTSVFGDDLSNGFGQCVPIPIETPTPTPTSTTEAQCGADGPGVCPTGFTCVLASTSGQYNCVNTTVLPPPATTPISPPPICPDNAYVCDGPVYINGDANYTCCNNNEFCCPGPNGRFCSETPCTTAPPPPECPPAGEVLACIGTDGTAEVSTGVRVNGVCTSQTAQSLECLQCSAEGTFLGCTGTTGNYSSGKQDGVNFCASYQVYNDSACISEPLQCNGNNFGVCPENFVCTLLAGPGTYACLPPPPAICGDKGGTVFGACEDGQICVPYNRRAFGIASYRCITVQNDQCTVPPFVPLTQTVEVACSAVNPRLYNSGTAFRTQTRTIDTSASGPGPCPIGEWVDGAIDTSQCSFERTTCSVPTTGYNRTIDVQCTSINSNFIAGTAKQPQVREFDSTACQYTAWENSGQPDTSLCQIRNVPQTCSPPSGPFTQQISIPCTQISTEYRSGNAIQTQVRRYDASVQRAGPCPYTEWENSGPPNVNTCISPTFWRNCVSGDLVEGEPPSDFIQTNYLGAGGGSCWEPVRELGFEPNLNQILRYTYQRGSSKYPEIKTVKVTNPSYGITYRLTITTNPDIKLTKGSSNGNGTISFIIAPRKSETFGVNITPALLEKLQDGLSSLSMTVEYDRVIE